MNLKSLSWFALLAATPAAAINWPQPGLNAAHTGYNNKETTLGAANIGSLIQKWIVPMGTVSAAPIEMRGIAYVQSGDGNVYAINVNTGNTVWTYAAGTPVGLQGVTAAGKLVYAPCDAPDSNHHGICALNAATGALVWNFAVVANVTSSYAENVPVVDHGKIFFAYFYGGFGSPLSGNILYALDALTGNTLWSISDPEESGSPFAVSKDRVFYQTASGSDTVICAVNEADGTGNECSPSLSTNGYAAISVGGGKVLSQNNDGNGNTVFTALDETSLTVVWQAGVTGITSNYSLYSPTVAAGRAYFYAGQNGAGSLYALSLKNGKQLWTYPCGGAAGCINSGVSVANGVLYASCDQETPVQGDQCAFNAKTGALLRLYGSTDGDGGTEATPLVANGAEIGACGAYAEDLCKFAP